MTAAVLVARRAPRVPTYLLRPGDRVRLVELGRVWHPARQYRGSVVGTVSEVVVTGGRAGRRSARVCLIRLEVSGVGRVTVVCTEAETHWRES